MESIVVNGGQKLHGTVATSGAKNAALPVLISTLLADGTHEFERVPVLRDIDSTHLLLEELGCTFERDGGSLKVQVAPPKSPVAPYDLVRKMRARAETMGLDPNIWFRNVEHAAQQMVGSETTRYVANIYKYYLSYSLLSNLDAKKAKALKAQTQ